ncbi:aspartate aminotransferase family protein [Parasedimentitalea maritima]|uniref:Aminotransferase class III-fold pyridoxal phosphate-dependent enzyme n=1 Tax=Parasedimentitalea maritima TaxID=2578117 RepID=A0A6A4REA5_9RHOB|nr:aspartate aminotransferase family protein [Zongyanglinia marina]KAE9625967.1 aminotransferase class III-fold pyridoxal phosphate-dependent enzyme [Zongyanglinia marina]
MSEQSKSAALYDRAKQVMPGGCSRNTILRKPHPIYAAKGEGCFVTDIEGVKRIDYANNVASLIHGHAHPRIVQAVNTQLANGSAFTLGTEIEVAYAEQMVARSPNFEKIRFVNSGTEAVMSCIKAARAYTGRAKIAKVEGSYHGLYDYAEVSQTAKPASWGAADAPNSVPVAKGTPQSALDDVVVIPFNDPERAIAILDAHKTEIAGILIDLLPHRIGVIPAQPAFVEALRNWATANGVLMIIDEVITFRTYFGGAQADYNIKSDLTAMGKMIGGGFPVGAIAGRADVMDVMDPTNGPAAFPHYGTFNANPITMTAGSVTMGMFDQSAVTNLNALADKARAALAEAIRIADVPACVTGRGSMFRIHMKEQAPTTYRNAFVSPQEQACISGLLDHMFDNGLIMIETCSGLLSTPMTQSEIDHLADTALNGLRKIKPLLLATAA